MIKTSLLGTFCLALFVEKWNTSKNNELKQYIRSLLTSNNSLQIHTGLTKLFQLVDEEMKNGETNSSGAFIFEMRHILSNSIDESGTNKSDTGMEKIRADLAYYFATMFKAGYNHLLPMPHFGYSTDPHAEE